MDGSAVGGVRIVITGRGVVSAIGTTVAAFEHALEQGIGGIAPHDDLLAGQTAHVGLAGGFAAAPGLPEAVDRTAQLAAAAALQAVTEAGLWDGSALCLPADEVALLLGSSHGGRSQIDRFVQQGMNADDPAHAHGVLELGAHYQQTAVVAAVLGVRGPVVTLSTACSSSGTAIAHGIELLRTGQARAVVAGGADAFSLLTFAGFSALGAVADAACGPFGSRTGISLGEGAAFVVLERHDDAIARDATPLAELFGWATSWDAHHLTTPEPSGDGMRRAIEDALAMAGLPASAIDYINAHGTGTRANDVAETLAIKRVFAAGAPPVSASKSFTGHTLGASSAAGLLAGLAGARGGWLPPTLNFDGPRPGCDLDYVPNAARPAQVQRFLALSAAFGGCNCAIVAGQVDAAVPAAPQAATDAVVITGMGVISSLGCDAEAAFAATFAAAPAPCGLTVPGFDPRRHLPRGRTARMNPITQYSVAAIEQALNQAGWTERTRRPTALGLMVGLSRGAAGSFQACMESVRDGAWHAASPTAFPNLVMSSVGGMAAVAVGLKGAASTLVGEAEVGLALLGHAATLLAQRPQLDALVVLAADELAPLFLALQATLQGSAALPAAAGAVALVLERRGAADARGGRVLAELAGWAQSFDGGEAQAGGLTQAMRLAMARGDVGAAQVDLAFTMARGETAADQREARALRDVFGTVMPPVSALAGQAGWGEASGSLLAVAMAVQALLQGRLPPPGGGLAGLGSPWLSKAASGTYATGLIAGSSRHGSNAAVLLRKPGAGA